MSEQALEAQVRKEFWAQFRAKMLLRAHIVLYIAFIVGFTLSSIINQLDHWSPGRPSGVLYMALVWTVLVGLHSAYFYFWHGRGKARREEKIYAEVQRRKLLATDEAKFKNDDADYDRYALSDDGELFEYAEDELKRKYQA
ncbi:MAG: hypothetical protein RLP44_32510 [Aggregatilineales bacterium]